MYLDVSYYLCVSFRYLDTKIMDSNLKPSLKVKLSRLLLGIGVRGKLYSFHIWLVIYVLSLKLKDDSEAQEDNIVVQGSWITGKSG